MDFIENRNLEQVLAIAYTTTILVGVIIMSWVLDKITYLFYIPKVNSIHQTLLLIAFVGLGIYAVKMIQYQAESIRNYVFGTLVAITSLLYVLNHILSKHIFFVLMDYFSLITLIVSLYIIGHVYRNEFGSNISTD